MARYRLPDEDAYVEISIRIRNQTVESVHTLPTPLLMRLHSSIDAQHQQEPSNISLRRIHTIVANELEIRGLRHIDTEGYDWDKITMQLPDESLEIDELLNYIKKYKKKRV